MLLLGCRLAKVSTAGTQLAKYIGGRVLYHAHRGGATPSPVQVNRGCNLHYRVHVLYRILPVFPPPRPCRCGSSCRLSASSSAVCWTSASCRPGDSKLSLPVKTVCLLLNYSGNSGVANLTGLLAAQVCRAFHGAALRIRQRAARRCASHA